MLVTAITQSIISILFFLIASLLGVLLRFFPFSNLDISYKYIVHTHSHIALLGWIYIALTALIFHLFIKKESKKRYSILFFFTQFTILGMLLSFPITGYALFSIIFSTLFLISSYWFYYFFRKHHNCNNLDYSFKFINVSLKFMIISSFGPWLLGIIMNTLGSSSHWYKNAIYFYLHFQYNGWFIFCLLGLFFYLLEKKKVHIYGVLITSFYKYLIISCCFTVFLSFLWIKPPKYILIIAVLGAVCQLIALGKFQAILNIYKTDINSLFAPFIFKIIKFAYLLFIIKIILQFLSSIPYFATLIFQFKDFVIAYLHMVFLGIISISIFVFLKLLKLIKISTIALIIFLLGFLFSETLIVYKGFCNWQQISIFTSYYETLVVLSSLMPLGVLVIFLQNIRLSFSKIL